LNQWNQWVQKKREENTLTLLGEYPNGDSIFKSHGGGKKRETYGWKDGRTHLMEEGEEERENSFKKY